jgi:phage shock protein A
MGIFDVIKGIVKAPFDAVKNIFGGGGNNKDDQRLMNQQIKDYQEQTRITKEELARAKDEKIAEKRRINEKQIRSLRGGKSSSRGFLGSSNPDAQSPGMSSQLGG